MRARLNVSIVVLVSSVMGIMTVRAQDTATLTVEIYGIKTIKGAIMVAVYKGPEKFLSKDEEPFTSAVLEVTAHTVTHTIENLPIGDYAISLFHDVDNSGTLDVNLIGIPKEPYAFSNNARGRFGPPTYEKAVFRVTAPEAELSIGLK